MIIQCWTAPPSAGCYLDRMQAANARWHEPASDQGPGWISDGGDTDPARTFVGTGYRRQPYMMLCRTNRFLQQMQTCTLHPLSQFDRHTT